MRKSQRFPVCILLILISLSVTNGQSVYYEAEAGTLTGSTLAIGNTIPGYSGTGYVGRFDVVGDKLTIEITLAQAGNFNLYIGYNGQFGDKINYLTINGNTAEVSFPQTTANEFKEASYGKTWLNSGSNTVSITGYWGWFYVDYLRIEPNTDPEINVNIPYSLVTPNPTMEARRLFSYLMDNFTENIHSGAMSLMAIEEAEWLFTKTGKYPALIGLDFMNHTRSYGWTYKSVLLNEAKDWYAQNGLVAICWHWRDPSRLTDAFYTEDTNFNVFKINEPASAEYKAMIEDIDTIANYLRNLQDANVPVLFRPLHEAAGKWFWWGAKGASPCKALWKVLYDRLVNYHGLRNLIWVWTTNTESDNLNWYPGDQYVDIVSADIYAPNGDFGSQVLSYNAIKEKFEGRKLITLSECGVVPDPDRLQNDRAGWSWFMPWYGDFIRSEEINPLAHWQEVMDHEYVITLDEMPDLKNYPARDFLENPQGFFIDEWEPKTHPSVEYNDVQQTTDPVLVAITIDYTDTLTRIPVYIFGDNANPWAGDMSDNDGLMEHVGNRNLGVLRGPGGDISDVYFWNRNEDQKPDSVPVTLMGSTDTDWPWYGDVPSSAADLTMDIDSFYQVLGHAGATGMITVNYGYARYGKSKNPVTKAAHMAADWVRYDNGRSLFWEIGDEVFNTNQPGYRIDITQNLDGQPEYITPGLYAQHCRIFIDSMRAAAAETGTEIRIGVAMLASSSTTFPDWNKKVAEGVGDIADFYSVHSFYTPTGENSTVETILNSCSKTGSYKNYVWGEVEKVGMPHLPLVLAEYNINATGSNQAVSHINGMHAVLVTGEAMKNGYGVTCRWGLADGWNNGNDPGMFSYGSEPGVELYNPRPAFYHLYYLQKFSGDVLLSSTQTGAAGVVAIPTAFSSGPAGVTLVNTSERQRVVRLNIRNFKFGGRYYTYTVTGTAGENFSRKVYVNGVTTTLSAGGPPDYATLKAESSIIGNEVVIKVPAFSAVYTLIESGTKELTINNQVTSTGKLKFTDEITLYPNPSSGTFTIKNIPEDITSIQVFDIMGSIVYIKTTAISRPDETITLNVSPGIYFINLNSGYHRITKKLIIN